MKLIRKNEQLTSLIGDLKKVALEHNVKLWKRIAIELEKPTRHRRIVNVGKINKFSKAGEIVIVPGKVLGMGELSHGVTVAALSFSLEAKEKISATGKILSIPELIKSNPKASKVKILG